MQRVSEIQGSSTPAWRAKPAATAAIVPAWVTMNSVHPKRHVAADGLALELLVFADTHRDVPRALLRLKQDAEAEGASSR